MTDFNVPYFNWHPFTSRTREGAFFEMLYNIHTHSPLERLGVLAIDSLYYRQPNGPTSPWRSAGLHPWHVAGIDLDQARQWLESEAALPHTLAIGEAGLDKVVEVDWATQLAAFQCCIEVSEKFERPMVLHCVRAYEEVIALKKQSRAKQAWIFHGFGKSPEAAKMALKAGCYLSFGSGLLRENSHAPAALREVPSDRYFLENDVSNIAIEEIYARAAGILGKSVELVAEEVARNFAQVFEHYRR